MSSYRPTEDVNRSSLWRHTLQRPLNRLCWCLALYGIDRKITFQARKNIKRELLPSSSRLTTLKFWRTAFGRNSGRRRNSPKSGSAVRSFIAIARRKFYGAERPPPSRSTRKSAEALSLEIWTSFRGWWLCLAFRIRAIGKSHSGKNFFCIG